MVIIVAGRNGATPAPAEVGAFPGPEKAQPTLAYDVQRVEGNRLTVTSGTPPDVRTFDLSLPADVRVDVLEPLAVDALNAGDWMTVVGITNAVRNLSIRLIVIIPNPGQRSDDGLVRSVAGFIGHEGARDPTERPVLWGMVATTAGKILTVDTPHGRATVEIGPDTPLRRLRPGTLADLHDGDRIVVFANGSGKPDFARGVLVRTGGAR